MRIPRVLLAGAALALGGCAMTYDLTLMPRDSGKLYHGTADDAASSEGRISITIEDKTYAGTWVQATPGRTYGYATGGYGWGYGRHGGWGLGTMITMDNPEGGSATALLQSQDGAGLRCEFRGTSFGYGGGSCRDDTGRAYDVQLRPRART